MPTKQSGDIDWNKFFMGIAVSVVFVLQGYTQLQQEDHSRDIKRIDNETLTREEINTNIDKKVKGLIEELISVQKDTLKLNKEWMIWQKKNVGN